MVVDTAEVQETKSSVDYCCGSIETYSFRKKLAVPEILNGTADVKRT